MAHFWHHTSTSQNNERDLVSRTTRRREVPPGWKDESFEGLHMMGVWTDYTRQAEYVARATGTVHGFGSVTGRGWNTSVHVVIGHRFMDVHLSSMWR